MRSLQLWIFLDMALESCAGSGVPVTKWTKITHNCIFNCSLSCSCQVSPWLPIYNVSINHFALQELQSLCLTGTTGWLHVCQLFMYVVKWIDSLLLLLQLQDDAPGDDENYNNIIVYCNVHCLFIYSANSGELLLFSAGSLPASSSNSATEICCSWTKCPQLNELLICCQKWYGTF